MAAAGRIGRTEPRWKAVIAVGSEGLARPHNAMTSSGDPLVRTDSRRGRVGLMITPGLLSEALSWPAARTPVRPLTDGLGA